VACGLSVNAGNEVINGCARYRRRAAAAGCAFARRHSFRCGWITAAAPASFWLACPACYQSAGLGPARPRLRGAQTRPARHWPHLAL